MLSDPKPRRLRLAGSALLAGWLTTAMLQAGPFAPGPGSEGTTAIDLFEDDEMTQQNPELSAWASAIVTYSPGGNVSEVFQTPSAALGPADDTGFYQTGLETTVTLGDGGFITLTFATPIRDTDGFDLVVFENGIRTTAGRGFFELAFVEISSDGVLFHRFAGRSTTPPPASPYAFLELDPTDLDGLAGKYPATYGTPFDFAWLGLTSVSHVRIVDILGDGQTPDAEGRPIYDPYPTAGSAGFDLDAVAAHVTRRYSTWRKARFAWQDNFSALSEPSADADADGSSNLMEYAWATSPTDPSSRRQPTLTHEGQELRFVFWRDPHKTDLRLAVEISSDLQTWAEVASSTGGLPFQVVSLESPGMSVAENTSTQPYVVTVTAPPDGPRRFFRISVALAPLP